MFLKLEAEDQIVQQVYKNCLCLCSTILHHRKAPKKNFNYILILKKKLFTIFLSNKTSRLYMNLESVFFFYVSN